MSSEPHWLGLKFKGARGDDLATRVHATLARVGIILDPGLISYIASIMFGEGLDGLHCGYCGHRGVRHTWGVDVGPDGSFSVDHFNCRDCALERDTSLVVCYIRPGGGARRDGY